MNIDKDSAVRVASIAKVRESSKEEEDEENTDSSSTDI